MNAQPFELSISNIVRVPETPKPSAIANPLSGALKTIALGIPVAPVAAGQKKPPIKDFPALATTDRNQILKWATEYPNCNWACVARPDGFCFMDEDDWERLHDLYYKKYKEAFPEGWTTQSRPGHRQSAWKQTDRTRTLGNKVQGDFIDGIMSFRQDGEYVLAAMSHLIPDEKQATGHRDYVVVNDSPVIEMPDRLVDFIVSLLLPKSEKITAETLSADSDAMIPEHYRNDTLASIAGKWRHVGLSEDAIRSELHRVNEERCDPRLSELEVDGIVDSICKYKQGDPRPEILFNKTPNPSAGIQQVVSETPAEWGTPEEISDALLPVKPFDLEYLPFCLRDWAQDVSERMSIPLDFTGVSIIVALAGAIGRRAFVYPKESDKSWKEAICVSGAVCAPSGKLKTPAFKVFMAPFQQMEMEWNASYKTALAEFMEAQKAYELRYRTAVRLKVAFEEEPPEEPKEPRRIILNDSTPEKAHSIMAKNPAGILLYRDEFASWVAELEKEGRESQRGLYLAAMNGNDMHSVDRVGRGSNNAIMCASLFGGFQPEMLRDFLGDSRNIHDGMLARFGGLVWPDDAWMPPVDRGENLAWKDLYNGIIRKLAVMEPKSVELHFAPDAQVRFNAWRLAHMERVAKVTPGGKQSHLAKYHGLLPKLAGLLMLADLAALALKSPGVPVVNLDKGTTQTVGNDTTDLTGRHMIDLAHLEQAIGLLGYFESHMERVYACALSADQKALHTLAKHIQQGDLRGRFRLRDIRRKHWTDLGETKYIECAADVLVEKGWAREIEAEKSAAGGRPTEWWEINPKAGKS